MEESAAYDLEVSPESGRSRGGGGGGRGGGPGQHASRRAPVESFTPALEATHMNLSQPGTWSVVGRLGCLGAAGRYGETPILEA